MRDPEMNPVLDSRCKTLVGEELACLLDETYPGTHRTISLSLLTAAELCATFGVVCIGPLPKLSGDIGRKGRDAAGTRFEGDYETCEPSVEFWYGEPVSGMMRWPMFSTWYRMRIGSQELKI